MPPLSVKRLRKKRLRLKPRSTSRGVQKSMVRKAMYQDLVATLSVEKRMIFVNATELFGLSQTTETPSTLLIWREEDIWLKTLKDKSTVTLSLLEIHLQAEKRCAFANQRALRPPQRPKNAPKREKTVNAKLEEVSILATPMVNLKTFSEAGESRTHMLLRKSWMEDPLNAPQKSSEMLPQTNQKLASVMKPKSLFTNSRKSS
jgi:hypothetical protein